MILLAALLFIAIAAFLVKRFLSKNPTVTLDYSFGNTELKSIQILIEEGEFQRAAEAFGALTYNQQSYAVDLLALTIKTELLQSWVCTEGGTGLDGLVLATHYHHLNWQFDLNSSFAHATRPEQLKYQSNLDKAKEHLELIENSRSFFLEKSIRQIRVKLLDGKQEEAWNHFVAATNQESDAFWAYVFAADVVQPKWGGDLNNVQTLLDKLPQVTEIRMVVMLKLIEDSFTTNENLFKGGMNDLVAFASEQLNAMHQQVQQTQLDPLHRFVVFNYMKALAERLGDKQLKQTYLTKGRGFRTLLPDGPVF